MSCSQSVFSDFAALSGAGEQTSGRGAEQRRKPWFGCVPAQLADVHGPFAFLNLKDNVLVGIK